MRKTFEFIKNIKIVRPLDSKVDYETTIGEYYEGACDDIDKGIERLEKLEAVIELLKNEQFRNEISVLEDCSWDYNNYLKIPASKLFNREIFELLKEILKQ